MRIMDTERDELLALIAKALASNEVALSKAADAMAQLAANSRHLADLQEKIKSIQANT